MTYIIYSYISDQSKPDSIRSTGEKSDFMFEEAGQNSGFGACSSPPAFSDFNSANFSAGQCDNSVKNDTFLFTLEF